MRTAWICPGQGSQFVGMGKDLYEEYAVARRVFDDALTLLDFDLLKVMFEGPEEELKQTYMTQPAIFVQSVAVLQILRSLGKQADAAAGHSLGEYAALVAADAFGFEDGLSLVALRGRLMQRAGEDKPGTMAAIIGLSAAQVEECCHAASAEGIVQPANFNSPEQIVISGSVAGVLRAMEMANEAGASRVVQLVVSGAFHSPLMESAREELARKLATTEVRDPALPVYANVTARPVTNAEDVRELLAQQLISPVRWTETIQSMAADGVTHALEVGPGKVLASLMRRIDRRIKAAGVGDIRGIRREIDSQE